MLPPTVIAHVMQDKQGLCTDPQSLKDHLEMAASLSENFCWIIFFSILG